MSSHEPLRHLILPGALLPLPDDHPRPPLPALQHLDALTKRLRPAGRIECDEQSPSDPAEVAAARALGLPDAPGLIPWAAWQTGTEDVPCAWLKPCHWQLGMDHALLAEPADLKLNEASSRALLAAVTPLLSDDGIVVRYVSADAWLATGEVFRNLRTWSMRRAAGRRLTPDLLPGGSTASLRRLQNELQMLLYTHPVNDAREAARLPPINALWIEGAGVLDHPPPSRAHVLLEDRLLKTEENQTGATVAQALRAYHEAWQTIDADSGARLLSALQAGHDIRLTLCSPQRALELALPARTFSSRVSHFFNRRTLADFLCLL